MTTKPTSQSQDQPERAWYQLPAGEALEIWQSHRDGLRHDVARRRHEEHGPNRIRRQERTSAWRILLNQFTSPLIYVLLGALALTLSIRHFADAAVIGLVLVVNGTIGFVQEYQAQSAVQALMEMVSPRALVRRDGYTQEIDAELLVPGDIVVLKEGEIIPADARLVEIMGLRINEAALTGESVPADKQVAPIEEPNLPPADQRNMAFMSTAVTSGDGLGVVVAIGSRTQIGEIAEQVEATGATETPLRRRIDGLAKWITAGVIGVAGVSFGAGLLLGRGVADMLLLAVALAVSAIPEGLPIVVTVALAIGVRRMARRHAVIRNLPAVETLGSCTTILADKTGTLTQNRMTVRAVMAGDERFDVIDHGFAHDNREVDPSSYPALRDVLLVGLLCNDAELSAERGDGDGDDRKLREATPSGDPMEVALLISAGLAGMSRDDLAQRYPRRDKVPFRTEQRYMATVHDVPNGEAEGPLVLVKGAPERLVEMCDTRRTAEGSVVGLDPARIVEDSETLAAEGMRLLAMAVGRGADVASSVRSGDSSGLTFVGMQALLDPPRASAVGAVDRCHEAGIRVAMVTGDHATTAAAIGRQVHLDWPVLGHDGGGGSPERDSTRDHPTRPKVLRGRDLAETTDDELDRLLRDVNVYARVAPEQKLRIVERMKAWGEIVAVTGDGVNDAPALEAAHLGMSMGSGTSVAKEASDMVVTDDNFASVYAAVEEGRTAFRNIRMATFFLLSTGAAEVLVVLVSLAFDWPLPLLPAQILWLNVVTNGIADVALAFEPGERALFRRPPRPTTEGILDRRLIERLAIVGVWLAIGTLTVFWYQWGIRQENLITAQTATLTTFVLFQQVHVFNCRSEYLSVFHKSLLTNKVLFLGVAASLAAHIAAMYLPLTQDVLRIEPMDLSTWTIAVAVASTAILVNEAHKRLRPGGTSPRVVAGQLPEGDGGRRGYVE